MNNQPDDMADLRKEMEEVQYRLNRIESFLSSFEAGPDPSPIMDERFLEVIELLRDQEKVSASMLQRHLDIGFVRAGRIIDQVEAVGLITPPSYPISKPRDVYRNKIKVYIDEISK